MISARLHDACAVFSNGQSCVHRPVRDCPFLARTAGAPHVPESPLRFSPPFGGCQSSNHRKGGPESPDGLQAVRRLRQFLCRHLTSFLLDFPEEDFFQGSNLSIGPGYRSRAWALGRSENRRLAIVTQQTESPCCGDKGSPRIVTLTLRRYGSPSCLCESISTVLSRRR